MTLYNVIVQCHARALHQTKHYPQQPPSVTMSFWLPGTVLLYQSSRQADDIGTFFLKGHKPCPRIGKVFRMIVRRSDGWSGLVGGYPTITGQPDHLGPLSAAIRIGYPVWTTSQSNHGIRTQCPHQVVTGNTLRMGIVIDNRQRRRGWPEIVWIHSSQPTTAVVTAENTPKLLANSRVQNRRFDVPSRKKFLYFERHFRFWGSAGGVLSLGCRKWSKTWNTLSRSHQGVIWVLQSVLWWRSSPYFTSHMKMLALDHHISMK